jgi:phosphoglycerate dehydrogenase-like enzyme
MILFVNTPTLSPEQKNRLRAQRPADELLFRADLPETEQRTAFERAEAILGNPPLAWWETPPKALKFWQLDSAGFDGYRSLTVSVPVCNMGDWFAWPCAETIVAGILGLYRGIPELAVLQSQKTWVGAPIRFGLQLLRGKRVVVLGAGGIGRAVRQMLGGFDCAVQTLARTNPAAELHSVDELAAVLPQTDLVVNCLPGTATGFFTADLIGAMKPGSVFANVGRGTTVDEPALLAALRSGHLGGAVLDVTATEPLPADHPFWTLPNVVLSQHTGGGQRDEDEGKIALFLQNLHALDTGQPLHHPVDLSKGY